MKAQGFTLIEMLATTAIVAILAAITVPVAQLTVQRAKEGELRLALRQLREGIDRYKQLADEGRIARSADSSGYPPSLDVLVQGIPDQRSENGARIFLLRRLPRDPFASGRVQNPAETWGLRSYASPFDEPQEGADVYDIYSRATGKGLNGIPYKEW